MAVLYIVLNEHNTVFARSGRLYLIGFPWAYRVLNENGILIASLLQGSLGNRPTDHATRWFTIGGIYL